jgi:Ca-activated chloride channel family protein
MHGRLRALIIVLLVAFVPGCSPTKPPLTPSEERLSLEGALGNRYVPASATSEVTARLRVGTRAPKALAGGPINVALVIDTSGSMEGKPIEDARAASLAMMESLSDRDRLAIIAFHSRTELLVPSTELDGESRTLIREKLASMKAQGTTDLAGGLRAGLAEVQKAFDPHGINRIVLLGDGVPNRPSGIRELADSAGAQAIPITALGLGLDYDESLMGAVAQRSGGQFHYVRESSEVASFFKNEVLRLKQVFARNAVLELSPGPGVTIREVVGEQSAESALGRRVVLGDISRSDTRDVVVKLSSAAHRDGAPVELLDAVLSYEDPLAAGARVEISVFLGAHATASKEDLSKGRNPDVEDTVATKTAAKQTLDAIQLMRDGENERAKAVLDRAAEEVTRSAEQRENPALKAQARSIRELGQAIAPAPMASPPSAPRPSAKAPAPNGAASVILRVHDEAIQNFQ